MQPDASYRPEIDGLRALAVLAIMAHHAGVPWLGGGYLGVDLFFVISGFVITRLILAEQAAGTFSLSGFWRRRMRRILPALAVVLAFCLGASWYLMSPKQLTDFMAVFFGALALVPNIVLWTDVAYFTEEAATRPLLHLWSLGVEEQFYLFFPVLMLLLWNGSDRARWWTLAILATGSLVVATVLLVTGPKAGFYLLPSRAWELLAGALAALSSWRPATRTAQGTSLAGLGLILLALVSYRPVGPGPLTLVPVMGVVFCLLAARPETFVGRILSARPLVLIGKGSYGAYLWHWPLLAFARIQSADEPALSAKLGLMLLALVLGIVSWRWLETPFRRADRPVLPRAGILAGSALLAGLAAIGGLFALADARGWRNLTWPGWQPAEMAALTAERHEFIKSGPCHLKDSDESAEDFLAAWNCRGTAEGPLRAWPVALFGDSHGGDFGMVLRLTGRSPMQMTLWGCSIVPSQMRPECKTAAEQLRSAAREDGIKTVILVNRWQKSELSPEMLVELENYWSEVFPQIFLIGPLPGFKDLDERLIRWPRDRVERITADFGVVTAFAAARKRVAGSAMTVIDAVPLFCGDRPGCGPLGDGPLAVDYSPHLSVEGATGYAARLEASGQLAGIAP